MLISLEMAMSIPSRLMNLRSCEFAQASKLRGCAACVVAAVLLIVSGAAAGMQSPPPPFTGTYTVGPGTVNGGSVQFTLTLAITNNSGADVTNAVLTLIDPTQPNTSFGSITGVNIAAGATLSTSGTFTVPQAMYDAYLNGTVPSVTISFTDANANSVTYDVVLQ